MNLYKNLIIMEKINIAELLKDCPKGMELYSPMFGKIYLKGVKDTGHAILIEVSTSCNSIHQFYPDGKYNTYYSDSECLLFPSKDQRDWSKFQRTFKDGDIIYVRAAFEWVAIYKENNSDDIYNYVGVRVLGDVLVDDSCSLCYKGDIREIRHATEEEKAKLFQAIKANGYRWNHETNTLEKLIEPEFKVGDRIKHKTYIEQENVVTEIKDTHYILDDEMALPFVFQDEYELVPNKFDINTLVPFESRVLVRDKNTEKWKSNFWGFYDIDNAMNYPYECCGSSFAQCIPYEGNQHLLGKTCDCNEYYKTWEE